MTNTNSAINSANGDINADVAKNDTRPLDAADVSVFAAVSTSNIQPIQAFNESQQPGDGSDQQPPQLEYEFKYEELRAKVASKINFAASLPQIAIDMTGSTSPNSNCTREILLNGNWDKAISEIPILEAIMHSVNLEELQVLKVLSMAPGENQVGCSGTGIGGKQMKLDTTSRLANITSSSVFTGTPSPLSSDSGIEGDSTDGNLSWLLNYKINELPPVPDQQQNPASPVLPVVPLPLPIIEKVQEPHPLKQQMPLPMLTVEPTIKYHALDELGNVIELPSSKGYAMMPTLQPQQEKYHYVTNVSNAPPTAVAKYSGPKKPPFTYTELIEHALVEKGELTVSGIYQWISDHFPFYKQNDDRWKNSVRHNLSINPHFRKGSKAVHGAGHLWTIAQKEDHQSWQIKRQKMQQFIKNSISESSTEKLQEMELANATASILPPTIETEHNGHAKRMQPDHVAIEYVIDMSGGMGVVSLDVLCPPVTKEQVVEECGLTGDYFITDLHPATLGLNMTDAGDLLHAGSLYDDLNFPSSFELPGE